MNDESSDRGGSEADKAMRRASEHFARGRTQKAYDAYGEAADLYPAGGGSLAALRRGLAFYTRALLATRGDAVGDAAEDVERGEAALAGQEGAEARRLRALLRLLEAGRLRLEDDLEAAESALDSARTGLAEVARPLDLLELEREQVRLDLDRGRTDGARSAARRAATAVSGAPRLLIEARGLIAEVEESAGRLEAAILALEAAASTAFDLKLVEMRHGLEDRIGALRRRLGESP